MIMSAIQNGRFLIVGTISEICPRHDWSDECFIEGLRCDMEAKGNHYLLAYCRWSRDPLKKHGEHTDALMWSVLLGDLETAALLLSWGADPNGCKVCQAFKQESDAVRQKLTLYIVERTLLPPSHGSVHVQYHATSLTPNGEPTNTIWSRLQRPRPADLGCLYS